MCRTLHVFAFPSRAGAKFIRDGSTPLGDGFFEAGDFTGGDAMTVLFSVLMGSFSLGQAAPNFEHFAKARVAGYQVKGVQSWVVNFRLIIMW